MPKSDALARIITGALLRSLLWTIIVLGLVWQIARDRHPGALVAPPWALVLLIFAVMIPICRICFILWATDDVHSIRLWDGYVIGASHDEKTFIFTLRWTESPPQDNADTKTQ